MLHFSLAETKPLYTLHRTSTSSATTTTTTTVKAQPDPHESCWPHRFKRAPEQRHPPISQAYPQESRCPSVLKRVRSQHPLRAVQDPPRPNLPHPINPPHPPCRHRRRPSQPPSSSPSSTTSGIFPVSPRRVGRRGSKRGRG